LEVGDRLDAVPMKSAPEISAKKSKFLGKRGINRREMDQEIPSGVVGNLSPERVYTTMQHGEQVKS